jgi:hypothetical protein
MLDLLEMDRVIGLVMGAQDRACDLWYAFEDYVTQPAYLEAREACARAWEAAAAAHDGDYVDGKPVQFNRHVVVQRCHDAAWTWRNIATYPGPADLTKAWTSLVMAGISYEVRIRELKARTA